MLNNSEAVWHLSCDVFGFHEEKHTPVFSLELRPRFFGHSCLLGSRCGRVGVLGSCFLFTFLVLFCASFPSGPQRGELLATPDHDPVCSVWAILSAGMYPWNKYLRKGNRDASTELDWSGPHEAGRPQWSPHRKSSATQFSGWSGRQGGGLSCPCSNTLVKREQEDCSQPCSSKAVCTCQLEFALDCQEALVLPGLQKE